MDLRWGLLIAIYLFLGGLGAGAYLSSFAAEKGWLGQARSLEKAGYYIAAPSVAIGAGILVLDLGQGFHKPWLLIGLLDNWVSIMTWGTAILSAFIIIGLLKGYFTWKNRKSPNWLTLVGAILALATGAYTGLLIAVLKAIPLWNNYLMPLLFVVSALSTGLSATSLLAHLLESLKKGEVEEGRVCQSHLGLVSLEIIILVILFGTILAGLKGPVAVISLMKMISGPLALPFWVVLVGFGLMIPFLLFTFKTIKIRQSIKIPAQIGPEIFSLQMSPSVKHSEWQDKAILACDIAVIFGGLALRCLIIFAALPVWNGI